MRRPNFELRGKVWRVLLITLQWGAYFPWPGTGIVGLMRFKRLV